MIETYLVGGWPTPWNMLYGLIGSSSPIWLGKIKFMFQTTNQYIILWDNDITHQIAKIPLVIKRAI